MWNTCTKDFQTSQVITVPINTVNQISTKYENIAAKTKSIKKRPTTLTGFNFKGIRYAPGCKSYVAKYLADAGSVYLCANDSGSIPLSFENVFERAASADYWLNLSQSWQSLEDIIAEDNRYADFAAVKKGNVYCCHSLQFVRRYYL